MSLKDFENELAKGLPLSTYLLYSQDEFLLYDALCEIKKKLVLNDFNFDCYDLNLPDHTISIDELVNILNTFPFMSERRVVIVENIQKINKTDLKKCIEYLKSPSPSSLFIMFYNGKKPDLVENVKSKTFKTIYLSITGSLNKWIEQRARNKNVTFTAETIDYLIEITDAELGFIASEIDKFAFLELSHPIDVEDIATATYEGAEKTIFNLADAISAGNTKQALRLLFNITQDNSPEKSLGGLRWYLDTKKASSYDKKTLNLIRKWLYEADIEIKTSQPCAVESLILKLLMIHK